MRAPHILSSHYVCTIALPDILVPLDVYFVELSLDRGHDVPLHLHGHVLRQHRQQQPLLKATDSQLMVNPYGVQYYCMSRK